MIKRLRSRVPSLTGFGMLLLCVCCLSTPVHADDTELWIATVARTELTPNDPRWLGYFEVQPRFGDYGTRLIVRPALGFKIFEGGEAWLGYAWIPTVFNGEDPDTYENRLWQQWLASLKLQFVDLSSRTRLEQRFVNYADGMSLRLRENIRTNWKFVPDSIWYLPITLELMIDLNETDWQPQSGFDHYRLFGGLGLNVGGGVRFELGYALVHSIRDPGPDNLSHVASFSLYWDHKFSHPK